jgi:hypothetical protein
LICSANSIPLIVTTAWSNRLNQQQAALPPASQAVIETTAEEISTAN